MNIQLIIRITLILLLSQEVKGETEPESASENAVSKAAKQKQEKLDSLLQEITQHGVPGAVMAIHGPEGWWISSAGLARMETNIPMDTIHLQYLQSIAKTYMATAVMMLAERGMIDLESPIIHYLPAKYRALVTGADKITTRMLLSHTSGLPEYGFNPAYIVKLIQQPEHYFLPEEYLGFIAGKVLEFEPGQGYAYRNTNYLLLALITDQITGDHAVFIREEIFAKLKLQNTFYGNQNGYLNDLPLVDAYWDRYSKGILENVSAMQRMNVTSLIGDDGLVTTAREAVMFLQGLMEEKLVDSLSLKMMMDWVENENGYPIYGLGLTRGIFHDQLAIGHSGGGIGAGCDLYYFPEKQLYVFMGINLGTVTGSPLHGKLAEIRNEIYQVLL